MDEELGPEKWKDLFKVTQSVTSIYLSIYNETIIFKVTVYIQSYLVLVLGV